MTAARRQRIHDAMLRLADGDRAAFDPLFDELWPLLRRFCARTLGDDAAGQDAAQEALLRVLAHAGEHDRERDALTWALGIAAWECRSVRRRRQRRRDDAPLAADLADPGERPDEIAARRDLLAAAADITGALSALDADTLWSAWTGERDPAIPAATFRKRLERALARFRASWRSRHDLP
jgi:DNA-directed RNA polymerase specialized sigma24 family protein